MKNQVMLGAGAPSAVQLMVASFPSKAVRLEGGEIRIGTDAANDDVMNIEELVVNHRIGRFDLRSAKRGEGVIGSLLKEFCRSGDSCLNGALWTRDQSRYRHFT